MLRIFLLAPESNPDGITGPLIGYSHGEVLARLHQVTLVIRLSSLFGFFLRRGPIPFVIGPIKQSNGFQKFDLPRHFIPLTRKGEWALNLRLHRGLKAVLPNRLKSPLKKLREFWHRLSSR